MTEVNPLARRLAEVAQRAAEEYFQRIQGDGLFLEHEEREAIAQAISAELPTWRTMESAPRDTAVLLYGFGHEVGHFNTALNAWVACWDHRRLSGVTEPTHWQELPDPPPQQKPEQKESRT